MNKQAIMVDLLAEILFLLLPFLVLSLVFIRGGNISSIFSLSEWSFGACILFGQSLVKLVGGASDSNSRISTDYLRLYVTAIVVLGLVPALVLVVFTVDSAQNGAAISAWIQVSQVFLFSLSIMVFVVVAFVVNEIQK